MREKSIISNRIDKEDTKYRLVQNKVNKIDI